jgi:Fur family transcriptional regulator, ferric uptake regulator
MADKIGYNTKQRDLILSCLKKHQSQHVTVENMIDYLKQQGTSVGQATVYRNLDKLMKEGAVVKYAGAEGQGACFQYMDCAEGGATHYHLVCIHCGQMIHLQCEYLDEMTTHLLEHHQFNIDKYKTVIYGLCNECSK